MAILGITNRTENWKTAAYFAPLFGHRSVRLARLLLPEGSPRIGLEPGDVELELFWRGFRDHIHRQGGRSAYKPDDFARRYELLFPKLREQVEAFGEFQELTDRNYTTADESRLATNLWHTEIDIVLESRKHLFIGEAKHEMSFHAHSSLILTHQLIRQYVLASILLGLCGAQKKIVPFVVGDSAARMKRTAQVRFMLKQDWLREENVLEWSDIEALW